LNKKAKIYTILAFFLFLRIVAPRRDRGEAKEVITLSRIYKPKGGGKEEARKHKGNKSNEKSKSEILSQLLRRKGNLSLM